MVKGSESGDLSVGLVPLEGRQMESKNRKISPQTLKKLKKSTKSFQNFNNPQSYKNYKNFQNFHKRYKSIDNMYNFEIPIKNRLNLSQNSFSKDKRDKREKRENSLVWMQGKSGEKLKSLFCNRGVSLKRRSKVALKSLRCKPALFHTNIKISKKLKAGERSREGPQHRDLGNKKNFSKNSLSYRKSLSKLDKFRDSSDYQGIDQSAQIFPQTSCGNYLSRYEMKWIERTNSSSNKGREIEFGQNSHDLKYKIMPNSSLKTATNFYPKARHKEYAETRSMTFWDKGLIKQKEKAENKEMHESKILFNLRVPTLRSEGEQREPKMDPESVLGYNFIGKKRYSETIKKKPEEAS